MNRRPRRNHTPTFKAKVALAAIKGYFEPWLSLRSSSTCIPIRSHRGRRSLRKGQPMVRLRRRQGSRAASRRREVAACEDRRADAWRMIFWKERSARQVC